MASTSSALRQLSDANSPGTMLGQSATDLIRFYGSFSNSSGISQLAVIGTNTALMTTQAVSGIGSTFGFSTAAQVNQVVSTMTALFNLGIIG